MVAMASLFRLETLKDKLLLFSSVVMTISLMSMALVFTIYSENQEREDLINDMSVLAGVIGNRSVAALVFSDVNAAQLNLKSTALNEHVIRACIYDNKANLFADYTIDTNQYRCAPALLELTDRVIEHGDYLEVTRAVTDDGDKIGYISLHATNMQIERTLRQALITTILASTIILIIGVLFLNRLISRLLTPLQKLHDTAECIAKDPFSSLRATREFDDEVGHLVDVFNLMLNRLDEENQELIASQNRFRLLSENSPVGIYQMDIEGKIIYANERWHELTGLKTGVKIKEICRFLGAEDEKMYLSMMHKIQLQREPDVIEYAFKAVKNDNKRIFMEHIAPQVKLIEGGTQFIGYIGSLMDISELKLAQMELENLAFYDPLTNLPNRRFFRDHLQYLLATAHQDQSHVAILMLDLDDFKKINDTLGHDAGDQLLVVLAERLRALLSKRDVVSRMGGDEFIVLLSDIDIRSYIQRIAARLLNTICQPVSLNGHEIEVTASIGIAIYPEDATNPEDLIRNADLALYLSKEKGRNRLSFFSKELETIINKKVDLERKLKAAIKAHAFSFHVQPQWSLSANRIVSCEVLIRWFDDIEGTIPPEEFIPFAEESGMILPIGDWLIEEVIKSLSKHKEKLDELGIEYFAINLSAKQFFSSALAGTVKRLLQEYDIKPSMIEFELTESAVMEDNQLAIKMMETFKEIGCRLSIDDFGTGYSSLAYLKQFPIDAVKIDRSFISDIPEDVNDSEISAAIIAMGHNLGLEVVAEGVELEEQIKFLVNHKCDYAQGYLVAKPMPLEELFTRIPAIQSTMARDSKLKRSTDTIDVAASSLKQQESLEK